MRKVLFIYDDSIKPNQDIKSITGKKSFGNTIFKRMSLKDRVKQRVCQIEFVDKFFDADDFKEDVIRSLTADYSVFRMYSGYEILDIDKLSVLIEKSLFAQECYDIMCGEQVVAVMYPGINDYMVCSNKASGANERIVSDAFVDLSDINNFRTFITSGFEARFFNALKGDDYTVVKTSDNVWKLSREYNYFTLLPDEMKQYFATVYNYRETEGSASYTIERYHMTDLALRYVHGAISEEEFRAVMERLFHFISIRKVRQVSDEEYSNNANELYINKVEKRIEELKKLPQYERIQKYIEQGTDYKDIDEIFARYRTLYDRISSPKRFMKVHVVGHGDLCFSNILYNHDAALLKLIDPKGALEEDELYMNPYYDIAKLSHSVWGSYDYFNSDLYEIELDSNMKLKLRVDSDNEKYIKIFREYLAKNNIDENLVRLYEASLFLSMLPLHIDREKKVFGFVLNAIDILDELERA